MLSEKIILNGEQNLESEIENISNGSLTAKECYDFLILNKDYFIEKKVNENCKIKLDNCVFASIMTGLFTVFPLIITILISTLPLIPLLSILPIATIITLSPLSLPFIERKIKKGKVTKLLNRQLNILYYKICEEETKKEQTISKEKVETKPKEKVITPKLDPYILLIEKTMLDITSVKYNGYQEDLSKLFIISQKYLDRKASLKTDNDLDVMLEDKSWFQEINAIQAKINTEKKVKTDQDISSEALYQIREILRQNGVNVPVIIDKEQETSTFVSEEDYQPKLTL